MAVNERLGSLELEVVSDSERLQRDLRRAKQAVADFERKIEGMGPITRSQAQQLEKLEFNVRRAATAVKTAGDKTRAFKDSVGPAATALSGMASAAGGAGGQVGAFAGAIDNAAGLMMATGPWGLAIAGATFALGAFGEKFLDARKEAEKAARALETSVSNALKGLEDQAKSTSDQILAIGKSAAEAAREALKFEAWQDQRSREIASRQRQRIEEQIDLLREQRQEAMASRAGATMRDTGVAAAAAPFDKKIAEANEKLREQAKIMADLADRSEARRNALGQINRLEAATTKEKGRQAMLDAARKAADVEPKELSFIQELERAILGTMEDKETSLDRQIVSLREYEQVLGRVEGMSRVQIGASSSGDLLAGLAADRDPEGRLKQVSRSEFMSPTQEASATSSFSSIFSKAVSSGGFSGAFESVVSEGMAMAGFRFADEAAGTITSKLSGAFEAGAQVFSNVLSEAIEAIKAAVQFGMDQMGILFSSSESGGQFFQAAGAGGAGAGVMMGAGAFGAPLAAPAAVMAFSLAMVQATEGFSSFGMAVTEAMIPAVQAFEPFGNQLLAMAPLMGIMATAMAEVTTAMLANGGMEAMFQGMRLMALVTVRAAQVLVMLGETGQQLNIGIADAVVWIARLNHHLAVVTRQDADTRKAAAEWVVDAQIAADEASNVATGLGVLAAQLENMAVTIGDLTNLEDARAAGTELLNRHLERTADTMGELDRTTRNLPEFFKGPGTHREFPGSEDGGGGDGGFFGAPFKGGGSGMPPAIIIIDSDGNPVEGREDLIPKSMDALQRLFGQGILGPIPSMANQFRR